MRELDHPNICRLFEVFEDKKHMPRTWLMGGSARSAGQSCCVTDPSVYYGSSFTRAARCQRTEPVLPRTLWKPFCASPAFRTAALLITALESCTQPHVVS